MLDAKEFYKKNFTKYGGYIGATKTGYESPDILQMMEGYADYKNRELNTETCKWEYWDKPNFNDTIKHLKCPHDFDDADFDIAFWDVERMIAYSPYCGTCGRLIEIVNNKVTKDISK